MKTKIILAGIILCAATATDTHAVTKCVALGYNTTCSISSTDDDNVADWTTTCTTNGISTTIKGIGVCSATKGSMTNSTSASNLQISSTPANNRYCWCRMINPAVSRWIYDSTPNNEQGFECARDCAYRCGSSLYSDSIFRNYMFSNLSD